MLMRSIFPITHKGSSLIWGVGHDRMTNRLAVRMKSGRVYFYDGVPREVFQMFLDAKASAGGIYNKFVKGKFAPGRGPSVGHKAPDNFKNIEGDLYGKG